MELGMDLGPQQDKRGQTENKQQQNQSYFYQWAENQKFQTIWISS